MAYSASSVSGYDQEWHGGSFMFLYVLQVVESEDVVRSTILRLAHAVGGKCETRYVNHTYQTRCFPLGIALTAVTGPLPLGNLKVLWGSLKLLCKEYSSTVPFLLPAYKKLPSGDQQVPVHHGGTPNFGLIVATGFDCLRSQIRSTPSNEAERKVLSDVNVGSAGRLLELAP